ncbi:hypothetical protein [Methylobacterium oryzae]|uniref:Transposase n=1 Tax=Methylobacterium oryzae TaxID=334852 RepID=A0ABU7TL12_9HYPH
MGGKRDKIQQTVSVRHRMPEEMVAWLDPHRREQSSQTRLAYVRAATRTVTKLSTGQPVVAYDAVPEKDVRHAVLALVPPVKGDSWSVNCAVRRGIAARRQTPDGGAVFGSKKEMRRRTKGLIGHDEMARNRLLPYLSYGDRLYRGNRTARLVLTDAGGNEVAARALPVDPLPKKRQRESKKGQAYEGIGRWLRSAAPKGASVVDSLAPTVVVTALRLTISGETRLIPLVRQRGKQGRLLARVAWLASLGVLNVTVQVDDDSVHVTFDPLAVADHPERMAPTAFVLDRALGIDRNPNAIGATVLDVAMRDGKPCHDLPGKVVDHLLVQPNLDRDAGAGETAEAMAKAADAVIGLARKRRCGLIVVERLKGLRGGSGGKALNHLLSRWARQRFLIALMRRAALCGIRVIEVWAGYSTTIGNVCHDLPDACAAAAEMARRGLAREADEETQLLPAYDGGYVPGRLHALPPAPERRAGPRKEGTGAASRPSHAERVRRLAVRAEHVTGWKELHRELRKSGVRARRPHPVGASSLYAAARCGPSKRGRCYRPRGDGLGATRGLG